VTAARVHHSAIQVRDIDASLRFYRDGIGLEVLMDHVFEGDWPTLFDAPSTTLRSIFLGDRRHPDAGIVELVSFDVISSSASPAASPAGAVPAPPPPHRPLVLSLLLRLSRRRRAPGSSCCRSTWTSTRC